MKNTSGISLKIPTYSFRKKAVSRKRKIMKIKLRLKEYNTGEKVKLIEIIFLFSLSAG